MDNHLLPLPPSLETKKFQIIHSDPLPRWEQLPQQQRRDLIRLLAMLLGKRLPTRLDLAGQEASDE